MPRGYYNKTGLPYNQGWQRGHRDLVPPESRKRQGIKMIGDNNPAKKQGIGDKISKNRKGKCMGENHPNWNSGSSFEPYPTAWTDSLKESIRQRDDWTCQLCGIHQDEMQQRLQCHHIDYKKDNLNPDNLISLCVSCHAKTNKNRDYWTKYFYENKSKNLKTNNN